MSRRTLWIGTYPEAGQGSPTGQGEGIWRAVLDTRTGELSEVEQASVTPSPSYLAWGAGDLLYAVNEELHGGLTVLRRRGRRLEPAGHSGTGGNHPCHLHLHRQSGTLLAANYTSGSVAVIRLDPGGLPLADDPHQVIRFEGSGPNPARQEGSHAHYLLPADDSRMLVSDLGGDCVRKLAPDRAGGFRDDGVAVRLPAGSGPRHAVFSADGRRLHLVGELDGRLYTVQWHPETADGVVVAAEPVQPEWTDEMLLAHIVRAEDRLIVGVRGADRIATCRLGPDGLPGPADGIDLPGSWPRHHVVTGGWLAVAQQTRGGAVVLDDRGAARGLADIPSPACILPEPS